MSIPNCILCLVIEANTIFHTLAEGHAQVNLKFNVVAAYGLPFALGM